MTAAAPLVRAAGGRRRRPITAPLLLLALAGCAGPARGPVGAASATPDPAAEAAPVASPPASTAPAAPALALETFDSAWSRILHTYYDSTFGGLDWYAVRDELRPRAAAAASVAELRRVITEMLGRLGESHFQILPGEVADAIEPDSVAGAAGEPGDVGVELRVVGEDLVVFRVRAGSPADRAGVRTGWIVDAIDGRPAMRAAGLLDEVGEARRLAEARLAWLAEARLAGSVGDTVQAEFVDADGAAVGLALVPEPVAGTPVRFGNLPTMFSTVEHRELQLPDGCAGLIRFNVWMTPVLPEFEDALRELRHCRGIILDVRGNPGGVAGMIMALSGYFMDERKPLGIMTTRRGELRLVSMPRRVTRGGEPMTPYAGPLALIVDGQSMSASELFAAGLQAYDRARVFGETTGGQALPAMMVRLPNQDVLVHAFADYVDPDGVRIEGRGVIPDVVVPLTRADLIEGRDAPVEAALRWIASRQPYSTEEE